MGFDPSTRRSVGPDPLPGLGAAGHSQDPHFVRDARAPRAVKLVHRASSALPMAIRARVLEGMAAKTRLKIEALTSKTLLTEAMYL